MIFTWHKMASVCAKFHCHTISRLENTRVGYFYTPPPPPRHSQIKYATPDTPNKIGLIHLFSYYQLKNLLKYYRNLMDMALLQGLLLEMISFYPLTVKNPSFLSLHRLRQNIFPNLVKSIGYPVSTVNNHIIFALDLSKT